MTRVSESYASFAVCPDGGRIYCIRTESYIDIILSYIITAHLNENEKVDATYTFYKFVFDTANGWTRGIWETWQKSIEKKWCNRERKLWNAWHTVCVVFDQDSTYSLGILVNVTNFARTLPQSPDKEGSLVSGLSKHIHCTQWETMTGDFWWFTIHTQKIAQRRFEFSDSRGTHFRDRRRTSCIIIIAVLAQFIRTWVVNLG